MLSDLEALATDVGDESLALIDALWDAEILALVEALCDALILAEVEALTDREIEADTDILIESETITLLISTLSRE